MLGKFFRRPEVELSDRVLPGQHLAKGFPILTYEDTPNISKEEWELKVWGLARVMTFNWSDLMEMPQNDFTFVNRFESPLII